MVYYVIRVSPRSEENFLKFTTKTEASPEFEILFPRKKVEHVKRGKRAVVEVPLFPGYVFLRAKDSITPEVFRSFKEFSGFSHFLKQGSKVYELQGKDLELVLHFLKFGEIVQTSQVSFDEQQRIRVLSGPMEGMEGRIVHVDRRKRRAKILLDFDRGQFHMTLGFEVIEDRSDTQGEVAR